MLLLFLHLIRSALCKHHIFTLLLEDEALVHVATELWPLPLLSSLTNKVDDPTKLQQRPADRDGDI